MIEAFTLRRSILFPFLQLETVDVATMLPLICITALDFLLCLVTRVLLDETSKEGGEESEEATPPPKEGEQPSKGVREVTLV